MKDKRENKKSFNYKMLIVFADAIKQFYDVKAVELEVPGITTVQIKILHYLADHEGCNQQSLVEARDVQRSTISGVLSQMEKNELIVREKNEKDKRMTDIHLTKEGQRIAKLVQRTFLEYCDECMSQFSEEERDLFQQCLLRFTQKFRESKQ